MAELKNVTTQELRALVEHARAKILDVRSVDAYNGWAMRGEARGGHIKGAKSLPEKWLGWPEWKRILDFKGIARNDSLAVYGYAPEEALKTAERLRESGYTDVSVYNGFLAEWSATEALPMEKLPNYRLLVSPEWVGTLISGGIPSEYRNDRFIVCHAHYRNRNAYLGGHVPGAIDMDTLALESPETWNRRTPEELKAALEAHGVTADTTVVLYGKFLHPDNDDDFPGSAAGHIGAVRLAFIMMYAGVKDVRVLNGGYRSWVDAGFAISTEDVPKQPVAEFGADIPARPELAVDTPEAKEMLRSEGADLICVRSYPEYTGEVSGYNYIRKKGRIPGAVFADCGSDAYHMENYRNLDHTTREYHEISDIWKRSGIVPEKHLAFYCGTGWRGSEAWFNALLMGWPRVSVYDGGWFEWSNDPANPFETGEPKEN
ncbi:thiosulfate sulfurtransferase [Prosthecochloris sp. GSB1]|uniref:rhodanese-like domain-containing protein n=1 Tax=Prosthecochloris sp. GSB1 TaxID=281093 RepID=UPI000B8D1A55|nr:rhodanese-like domain-containing protein [Prosthecochloris sp. GSB1]ASQ90566.1 thiosulfate sulfurtransferase [Prosthecochloris sp. GSB1]